MKRPLVRALAVLAGLLGIVIIAIVFVATTETGARWVLARVNAAVGNTLRWSAAEGTLRRGLRLDAVEFNDGNSVLSVQRLSFAWQPWRLLDGTLVLDSVEISGLRYETRVSGEGEPLTETGLRELLFNLPYAMELHEFHADDVQLGASARFSLSGAATLDGNALTLTGLDLQQGTTRVTGDLQLTQDLALSGMLDWQTVYEEKTWAGTLTAGGSLRQLELSHTLTQPLQLTSRGAVVAGIFAGDDITFDLQHELPSQALTVFAQPDVLLQGTLHTAGTPEQADIDGSLHAENAAFAPLDLGFALTYGDAALVIDSATLTSTQIGLNGSGLLQLEPLALQFDWILDSLAAGDRLPQVELSGVTGAGSVQVAESGGTFSGALQITTLTGNLNGYPLAVAGMLNADAAGFNSVELRATSGANTLDVSGTAGSELALTWNVQAPALDVLWQGLTGELNGSGSIGGTAAAPQVNAALTGNMRLEREDDILTLESLTLDADYGAGGNDVQLELAGLTLTADGSEHLLLQQGQLLLTGTPASHTLSGSLVAPEDALQFSLQGAAVNSAWRGTLQNAVLDGRAGTWELESPAALEYTAGAVTVAQHCWNYLPTRLCLNGSKAAAQGFDAELTLTALPLAWLNPVATAPASTPAVLQIVQDTFALTLPEGVQTEGELDAQVAVRNLQGASWGGASWESLDAVLQPRAVVVQITQQLEPEEQTLDPLVQRFSFTVNRSEVHFASAAWNGAVDLQVAREEDTGSVVQGTLRGSASLAADDTLAGNADVAFNDLSWLEFLLPNVREPTGMLTGSLGLGGTRAQPQLQARMQLREGRFDLPLYGLDVHDVNLGLETGADAVLRITGSAQSGTGMLNVSAELTNPLQATRAVSAEVTGTDFLAFATDYANVVLSPQLQGSFAAGALTVNGSIDVAETEVDLEAVFGAGRDTVRVSRDVVIVSGEAAGGTARSALPITADLRVRLGENVHVHGYDLDAFLEGELRVEQTPGRPALVYGELDIPEGSYEIYNQRLNARDGRLVFFGNPANPLLDVRAFRETESGEVGVLLTGNLDSIQGTLYSTPALPANETLALLVTGKSFNSVNAEESDALVGAIASFGLQRGDGFTQRVGSTLGLDTVTVGAGDTLQDSALGLGKYLTPDLLMRYKVGLFDRQSVLGIEYTLSERLKLEVETGISQSVDLNYTIEKD